MKSPRIFIKGRNNLGVYILRSIRERPDDCSELDVSRLSFPRRLRTFVCSRRYSSTEICKYTEEIDSHTSRGDDAGLNAGRPALSIGNSASYVFFHDVRSPQSKSCDIHAAFAELHRRVHKSPDLLELRNRIPRFRFDPFFQVSLAMAHRQF